MQRNGSPMSGASLCWMAAWFTECAVSKLTIQLTDGGLSTTPEVPDGVAGPPFGEATGWPPH